MLLKARKAWEGYFTNDILWQAKKVMDILQSNYPSENHAFVYNNATTHLKWVDNALYTHKMPKNTPRHDWNWGVEVVVLDGDGKAVFDGKIQHQKVCMGDAMFADGGPQHLYFPEDHPDTPGIFKGMAIILEECGYTLASTLWVECKGFKCPQNATACYC